MFIEQEYYTEILKVLPIVCVDTVIVYAGRILLLLRDNDPAKGQYWFPGGRILKGELIEDAALRKVREEVNLDCKYERIISVEETIFSQQVKMVSDIHTVNICCQLLAHDTDNLVIDQFHDGYIWVNLEQAEKLNLHEAVYIPLRRCLEGLF